MFWQENRKQNTSENFHGIMSSGSCWKLLRLEPDFGVEVRRLRCLKNGAQEQNHDDLVLVQLHFFASARIHFGLMGLGGLGIVLLLMPTRRQIDAALPNACPFG
jgi:hypothetical protein